MATNNMYFIWGEEAFLIDQKIKTTCPCTGRERGRGGTALPGRR